MDVIPEARLNLVIYYLRQDDVNEAYALIKVCASDTTWLFNLLIQDLEPTVPQEYILKGVVNAAVGQENGSREHLKIAQQYFQLVGGSASECDTIPGRYSENFGDENSIGKNAISDNAWLPASFF